MDAYPMAAVRVDRDDPQEIADHLIQEHGIEGAVQAVMDGVKHCHGVGDYYALSVWRDVRRLLKTTEQKQ